MGTATLNGTERHAAVAAYRESVTDGVPLTGAQLAATFDRSDSWGRGVIREARGREVVAAPEAMPKQQPATIERYERHEGGMPEPAAASEAAPAPEAPEQRGPWLDTTITLVVAVVAAAASYGHMLHVAHMAGESLWIARAWPITVDGLAIAALRRGEQGRRWLLLALAVSVASNVLAGYPEVVGNIAPAVKAWPPLALYGCHRLLHGRRTVT